MKSIREPGIQVVVGWIVKYSQQNLWKVGGWYEIEDLVNDGLEIAIKCRHRLGDDVEPGLYVNYVKRAFSNHIISLARISSVDGPHLLDNVPEGMTETDVIDAMYQQPASQEVTSALTRLPENIKRVLNLLLTEKGRRAFYAPARSRLDNVPSETESEKFFRLAGWPQSLSFEEEFSILLAEG